MNLPSFGRAVLLCVSIAFVSQFAMKYYTRKKNTHRKEVHEVLIFYHEAPELHRSKYSRCMITESMGRLICILNRTRYTLDICVYVLTNLDIATIIVKLHYRGVKVRVIIDADMAYTSGSNIRKLEKQGIPVRWRKSPNLMHHKFCLLDASTDNSDVTPVIMTGSLNWTNQALHGNWENVIVTSQEELVRQYKEEFERLWELFKPIV